MGTFPNNAPNERIISENAVGTDVLEFVEIVRPDPRVLSDLFLTMSFAQTARHKAKCIALWRQGDITYTVSANPIAL